MEFKDYYRILGVDRRADAKAIQQAFRRLARQYHPDVNKSKDAENRFKEINEAYQVLNDPERRAKYDQLLDLRERGGGWEELLRQGARGGQAGRGPDGTYTIYGSPEDLEQFSDFFRQLFGGLGGFGGPGGFGEVGGSAAGRRGGRRGGFRLDDLFGGAARGRAGEAQDAPAAQDVEGTVEITLEEAFRGTERAVAVPGDGGRRERRIDVKIPKGVQSGQRIRAAGQGLGGDLFLTVQIAPHPTFTRIQDDIVCEVPVPVWTAALGGTVEVPTLGGPVTMTVPAGTRDGRTLRLRGRGMPHLRGEGAGDELVKVRLVLPDPLTPRDRELLEEMRRLHEGAAARRH
jgi:curved DNA-binding protein